MSLTRSQSDAQKDHEVIIDETLDSCGQKTTIEDFGSLSPSISNNTLREFLKRL